jgi:hypothetical protein
MKNGKRENWKRGVMQLVWGLIELERGEQRRRRMRGKYILGPCWGGGGLKSFHF